MALAPALPPAATPLAAALPPPTSVVTEQLTQPAKNDVALESRPATLVEINTPPAKPEPAAKPVQASATFAKPVVSNYEALKADPTVVMAPLPVEAPQPTARPVIAEKPNPVAAKLSDKADMQNQPQAVVALAAGKPKAIQANLTVKSEPEKSSSASAARIYVQAGSYFSEERAKQGAAGLESLDVKIMEATVNGRDMFRVRIGPFATMDEAKSAFAQAQALGRTDLLILKE
jgi:DedD protein